MNTFFLTLALTAALPASSWENSYSQAQQHALERKRPLVVLFGSGANGWAKVVGGDGPQGEVAKLLSDHYVCVYVDTASPAGKKLAQTFDVSHDVGLVISDRTGSTQAFWHQGDMEKEKLVQYLQKFADPLVIVNTTETTNTIRTSYYPENSGTIFQPGNNFFQGSSRSGGC